MDSKNKKGKKIDEINSNRSTKLKEHANNKIIEDTNLDSNEMKKPSKTSIKERKSK